MAQARPRPILRLPSSLQALADNPQLRRLEFASLLWNAAEQVYLVGLLVYAYSAAGTGGVAVVGILQAAPSIVLLPILLRLTGGAGRDRLVQALVGLRFVAIALMAVAATGAGSVGGVFGLAALDAIAATAVRPSRAALVPQIARSPQELVAANVSISAGRSLASLLGPAAAAALLAIWDVPTTFAISAALLGLAFGVSLTVRGVPSLASTIRQPGPSPTGVASLLRLRHPLWIVAVIVAQQLVRGMLPVLLVALAFGVLTAGEGAVGLLSSAIGLGGLIGGAMSILVTRRFRLATALGVAIALWGIGILGPGLFPSLGAAIAFLVIGGVGKGTLEVASVTLLQRTVPVMHRASVFGVVESVVTLAVAVGAVVGAVLVELVGPTTGLVISGILTLVLAASTWPVLRTADDAAIVPELEIRMLRGVPMLRPLTMCTKEELAANLRRIKVPAGTELIRQGDVGDAFYILESGSMEAVVDGVAVRPLGPGDSFGEIALLRDVPRTATVQATRASTVLALDREHFLAAVGGRREAAAAAEEVIRGRLGA
jgi:MFS family permease